MRDITSKQTCLREARAEAFVLVGHGTLEMVREGRLPKGEPFGYARAAAFLGAKQTHLLIPHCHPVKIDGMDIDFEAVDRFDGSGRAAIRIEVRCKAVDRTGIEMEAMTAASIGAVTLYDLFKPVDDTIEITGLKLLEKKGGKSDRRLKMPSGARAAILVCSDSTAAGDREDRSGKAIQEILEKYGCAVDDYQIVPDEPSAIEDRVRRWVDQRIPFIFTTGGTGLSPRDNTVEVVEKLIEREVPGIAEAMRVHGMMRTPFAMLSRSVAGVIGESIVVTLPGSSRGARESLDGILPGLFHAKRMIDGGDHPVAAGWDGVAKKERKD